VRVSVCVCLLPSPPIFTSKTELAAAKAKLRNLAAAKAKLRNLAQSLSLHTPHFRILGLVFRV
jgi:hypothetical protein